MIKTENTTLVVTYVFVDEDWAWVEVVDRGRTCYVSMDPKKARIMLDNGRREGNIYLPIQNNLRIRGLDITKKPHLEDAFPATQYLYREVKRSETSMCFVNDSDEYIWENHDVTREQFEAQVDADVLSYGLGNIITKNEDGALYTCYGDLQSFFTEEA
jgi:hypothetical protein